MRGTCNGVTPLLFTGGTMTASSSGMLQFRTMFAQVCSVHSLGTRQSVSSGMHQNQNGELNSLPDHVCPLALMANGKGFPVG
jgi:hypothetical protein